MNFRKQYAMIIQNIIEGGNMEDIFDMVREFNDKYFSDWRETPDIYLTAGEVGELCNAIKHYYGGGSKGNIVKNKEELYIECADILIYVAVFLMKNGVNHDRFKRIIENKIKNNTKKIEKREIDTDILQMKKNQEQSRKLKLLEKNSSK